MNNDHQQPSAEHKIAEYLSALRSKHEAFLQQAVNVAYALSYSKDALDAEISKLPQLSRLFQLLIGAQYNHLQLSGFWSFEQFSNRLNDLKEPIRDGMEPALLYYHSGDPKYREQLSSFYRELLDQKQSIQDIITQENSVLSLEDKDLFELITYFEALIRFKKELEQTSELSENVVTLAKFGFTRSQQVLVFHYLLASSGVRLRHGASVTDCAMLLHQLLGVNVSDIANSDLYKKLKRPLEHSSASKMIQNLQIILPYFEALPHIPIVELIDKDLKTLRNSL